MREYIEGAHHSVQKTRVEFFISDYLIGESLTLKQHVLEHSYVYGILPSLSLSYIITIMPDKKTLLQIKSTNKKL